MSAGAVLLKEWEGVNRQLLNYSTVEKEALALV